MMRSAFVVSTACAFLLQPLLSAAKATEHLDCQDVGHSDLEKVDTKEGHGIASSTYSCLEQEGPLKGAIITGTNLLEWNGPTATIISGSGVARSAQGIAVFKVEEGKLTLVMDGGKVVGWTAEGRNSEPVATGSASNLQGKTVTWKSKATGVGTFTIDAEQQ